MAFLSPLYIISTFLVFVRVSGLMATAPFFGHQAVPVRVKIPVALLMAWILVSFVPGPPPESTLHPVGLMVAVGIEALTGAMMGYAAQFVFFVVTYAGEIIGFQMGLSMAAVYNPVDGHTSNPLGRFMTMGFLIVFILLDGPHFLIQALVLSFESIPLSGANLQASGPVLLEWMGAFFMTGLRLASPFMITIFLIDLSLGIFARVAPQADLFSLGLPLKLFIGLAISIFFMQAFVPYIPYLLDIMVTDLTRFIEAMAY